MAKNRQPASPAGAAVVGSCAGAAATHEEKARPLRAAEGRTASELLFALVVGTALPLYGQAVKGTLLGTVTDSSKAVVPDATVEITETNTVISRRVTTNQNGYYVFADLESGVYGVEVEHPGLRRAVRERAEVLVNSTVRVDFELEPGVISESVAVTAQAEVLQTDRADTGRKIETRQLSDMPLLFNRNFQSLVALVPGAGRAFRPHSEFSIRRTAYRRTSTARRGLPTIFRLKVSTTTTAAGS